MGSLFESSYYEPVLMAGSKSLVAEMGHSLQIEELYSSFWSELLGLLFVLVRTEYRGVTPFGQG